MASRGLAHVNIIANMLLGAISGSAAASASAIGGVMHKRMVDEGYDPELSAAVNISSLRRGWIIPPVIFSSFILWPVRRGFYWNLIRGRLYSRYSGRSAL
ncbi:MAG: TRAP transporter large permease subunit [Bacteroidia bacterium]